MRYPDGRGDGPVRHPELASFFADEYVTDVLSVVKSGKEATVLCCEAHPSMGVELLAAKVYHPRDRRDFRNDAVYREGRWVPQTSLRRAIQRKTEVGREAQFLSWAGQQFKTLNLLHDAGADVPKPYALARGAVLMEYVGDREGTAPPLRLVRLDPDEARPLFERMLRNVELWLACDRIHADLSPYNILYWQGGLTVIDFPQVVHPRRNPSAALLLERDIEHLCRYWARQGVHEDPAHLARRMCGRYLRGELRGGHAPEVDEDRVYDTEDA